MSLSILNLVKRRVVLFDGGLGTELMKRGLIQGTCPELWNLKNPEIVKEIHRDYYQAGADSVSTNSLGGNKIKLSFHSLEEKAYELNYAAAKLANQVRPEGKFVAGSMGPTGKFLKPQGEFEEHEFEEAFALQAEALAEGGVDFFLIETMYDLREALCALKGAKRVSHLPVFVTMTFNRTPRGFFTLMGDSVGKCLRALADNGASAVGSNCTLASAEMADLVQEMKKETELPLIAQPNAGQPSISPNGVLTYSQGVDDYLQHIPKMIKNGARIIGGCCGTNPDYIKRMAEIIRT